MASPQETLRSRRELFQWLQRGQQQQLPEKLVRFRLPAITNQPESRWQFLKRVPDRFRRLNRAAQELMSVEPTSRGKLVAAVSNEGGQVARFLIQDPDFGFVVIPFLMGSRVQHKGHPVDPAALASGEAGLPRVNVNTVTAEGGVIATGIAPENVTMGTVGGIILGPLRESGDNPGLVIGPNPGSGSGDKLLFPLAGSEVMVNGEPENGPGVLEAIRRGEFNGQPVLACAWLLGYPDGEYGAAMTTFLGIGPESIAFCPLERSLERSPNSIEPRQLFPIETADVHLATSIAVDPNFYLPLTGR